MYVRVEDVMSMEEVHDNIVHGDSIVVLTHSGEYYSAKQNQPRYSDVRQVPFYPASDFQIRAFKRLVGTGSTTVGKLDNMNEELNSFHNVQIEERLGCEADYYDFSIHDAMPGAFDLPWYETAKGLDL